jgi:hypothetical protein
MRSGSNPGIAACWGGWLRWDSRGWCMPALLTALLHALDDAPWGKAPGLLAAAESPGEHLERGCPGRVRRASRSPQSPSGVARPAGSFASVPSRAAGGAWGAYR